jgi:hypothetical protein
MRLGYKLIMLNIEELYVFILATWEGPQEYTFYTSD